MFMLLILTIILYIKLHLLMYGNKKEPFNTVNSPNNKVLLSLLLLLLFIIILFILRTRL